MDARAVVVCADHEQAVLWADAAPAELRAHPITGLARTAALLKEGRVGVLAGSPPDLPPRAPPSALKLETIETLALPCPEGFAANLDTRLPEPPTPHRGILRWIRPLLHPSL